MDGLCKVEGRELVRGGLSREVVGKERRKEGSGFKDIQQVDCLLLWFN